MDILQGYGTVTPNFPSTAFGGSQYRVTIDVPVGEENCRVSVPAGSIARAGSAIVSNVFGTVTGIAREPGTTYNVIVSSPLGSQTLSLQNFAFGGEITSLIGINEARITLQLVRIRDGASTVILTKRVNKGRGGIGVTLNFNPRLDTNIVLPGGIASISSGIQLWRPQVSSTLGLPANQIQFGRWNPTFGRFQFYPDLAEVGNSKGYFIRTNGPLNLNRDGISPREVAYVVPLIQGWNFVSCPQEFGIPSGTVEVITQSNAPVSVSAAIGVTLGSEFYSYERAANSAVTGVSEQGTLIANSLFSPTQGTYVRCFDPKGASLVFYAPGSRSQSEPAMVPSINWLASFEVKAVNGDRALAKFGQALDATSNFDRKYDSDIPASLGGMSVKINTLGKDVRRLGPATTYQAAISGLVVGKNYTIKLSVLEGNPPFVFLFDHVTRANLKLRMPANYTFRAVATSQKIRINSERL